MATRRLIHSVLHNFLGTYASRISSYGGYLLFGYLVADLSEMRIDLLGPAGDEDSPQRAAVHRAVTAFEGQRRQNGLRREWLQEAALTLTRLPGQVVGNVNGHPVEGFLVRFTVVAVLDNGRSYERTVAEFVAPNDRVVRPPGWFWDGAAPAAEPLP